MSSPLNSPCAPNQRRTDRGSAVITVLVLAAVAAVIASGFLFRSAQEAKLAGRSIMQYAALNLAEAGVEEALYAVNSGGFTTANDWNLVSGSTTDYKKIITTGFELQQGTGSVYIRVDLATSSTPAIVATGVITIPNQPTLLKQIRVGTTSRRIWANAMAAKGTITFSGNASVDGYDSSLGPWNAATNRNDRAVIGSSSTGLDPIDLGSKGSVYGYVATAGNPPDTGKDGKIYGATTPVGVDVDTSRIRLDFAANLPDVTVPPGTPINLGVVTTDTTLPRVGDVPGANGRYLYIADSITLHGKDDLYILGNVDLIVEGNTSVKGDGIIQVGNATVSDASLSLYTPGNVTLADQGGKNHHQFPVALSLYGTGDSTSKQTFTIANGEEFYGTIYAPNATLALKSGGDVFGAVIAKTVTLSNKSILHYDTKLETAASSSDTTRLSGWAELTMAPDSGHAFARDNREPFNTLF